MIAVVDYGVANLGSMCNMLRRLGAEPRLASTAGDIERADKLILPGIGAFDQGMQALEERKLAAPLRRRAGEGVVILGVCLGLQLLGRASEEGKRPGLGLIDASCGRLQADSRIGLRVPHMGWCHILPTRPSPILEGIDATARFYFVHSYHIVCQDPGDVLATAQYGTQFTAMIQQGNIYGAQFHPEKSHRFGLRLLQNFAAL